MHKQDRVVKGQVMRDQQDSKHVEAVEKDRKRGSEKEEENTREVRAG